MEIDLILILSAATSILFAYVPGFETWYEPLEPTKKRLVMAGILLIVTAGVFAYNCIEPLPGLACDLNSAFQFLKLYVISIIANQGTHDLLGKFGKAKEVEVAVKVVDTNKRETAVIEADIKDKND